ncbi:MAG: hypothetical protein CL760_07265 [Chloroflexi bacterium]|nr:hypothetical protein [Chloroflexota bacterium]|tara:strand:- start:19189 stop:19536 length:348 start_codon:yes stop_codon:yes gene_type:complete
MIIVCNKKNMPELKVNREIIKIMRPSLLSNEFSHNPNSAAKFLVSTRKEAIEKYKEYFEREIKKNNDFRKEIIHLYKLAQKKHIYLMCCCKPQSCHGDVIKEFLEKHLGDKIYLD